MTKHIQRKFYWDIVGQQVWIGSVIGRDEHWRGIIRTGDGTKVWEGIVHYALDEARIETSAKLRELIEDERSKS